MPSIVPSDEAGLLEQQGQPEDRLQGWLLCDLSSSQPHSLPLAPQSAVSLSAVKARSWLGPPDRGGEHGVPSVTGMPRGHRKCVTALALLPMSLAKMCLQDQNKGRYRVKQVPLIAVTYGVAASCADS